MSFHPNDVARRARYASAALGVVFAVLLGAFFRTQVLRNTRYVLQSEENRLRAVPIPAGRGVIYDRRGQIIAENVPGYSVSILSPTADSLRASLARLAGLIQLDAGQIESAVRRYRRAPNRPAVVVSDAPFDVVSVLEEHRVEFPDLIIQSAPKRYYPHGAATSSFVGYVGEITEAELAKKDFATYKAGQQIGKGGLEREYEEALRGQEGLRFVEVDARGRVVKEAGTAREDLLPKTPEPLYTNIDLGLQLFIDSLFSDSLIGGVIAMEPRTGEVLALHSAPTFDPNRFIGGIPPEYWRALNTDPRRPLYNKVIQGKYPPASTFKLATSAMALELGLVNLGDHMPVPCTGGYMYGTRYFRCWDRRGHGDVSLARAIEVSCDVYFYQLGLKLGLSRLTAGGVSLGFDRRTGIDLPNEARPTWPNTPDYYDKRYGPRGWSNSVILNLAIGQGENDQTIASMARFYTALATDGHAARPEIVRRKPERSQVLHLTPAQMAGLRAALAGVVSRGTAAASQIQGVVLAGKTGTGQSGRFVNGVELDHAWFVGFAPFEDPKIVVAVMLEYGGHGTRAAKIASTIISRYLGVQATQLARADGG